MATYDNEKIKNLILKKYKGKIKPKVLEANIDGLVKEFIENREFVKNNNLNVSSLPKQEEISAWFEDELSEDELVESLKNDDPWMRVDMYKIYHKDKLAKEVYKNLYDLKWSVDDEVDHNIELMIKLIRLSDRNSTTKINKDIIISRMVNLALLGTVRYYHMERHPYFKESQIHKIIDRFFKVLSLIDSVKHGKYKDKNIGGEIYIFKSLDDIDSSETDSEDIENDS
jgi:hypothetical protein